MVKSEYEGVELGEGCKTPRHEKCRIMVNSMSPPPAPRKKRVHAKQHTPLPPKEGYFQPPDLEVFFAIKPRRETRI